MLDLDGNERANVGLRNNTFNRLQILIEELTQSAFPTCPRRRVVGFFSILDSARTAWERESSRKLSAELAPT